MGPVGDFFERLSSPEVGGRWFWQKVKAKLYPGPAENMGFGTWPSCNILQ